MADGREPVGLAMVLCDACHTDPGTGKKTLLGLFSVVNTLQMPAAIKMSVYCAITECHGDIELTLCVVDANEEREPLFSAVFQPPAVPDPLAVLDLQFDLAGLTFAEPGEYRVQLLYHGASVLERRLMVVLYQPPPPSEEHPNEDS